MGLLLLLLLLLLLQVAHSPALPASATMRTTGAGRETVAAARKANAGGDEDERDTSRKVMQELKRGEEMRSATGLGKRRHTSNHKCTPSACVTEQAAP
jgi:hypothetical protein